MSPEDDAARKLFEGVELWLVDLACAGPALAALEEAAPRLSDDERERAASLGPSGEDWRLLRVALRLLLERITGPSIRRTPFRAGPRGKPSLLWPAQVEFSLSHSGRYGLIAIADSHVGIDLELDRQVRFPADRQRAILAAAQALAPSRQPIGILNAWVRLEAWGKARGTGIGALLHDLGIRRSSSITPRAEFAEAAKNLLAQDNFELHDLSLPTGLYGALATRSRDIKPVVRELPADQRDLESLQSQNFDPQLAG